MNLPSPPRFPVTVGPTPTTVVSVDVRPDELVTLQIDNLDGTQTFSGTVERRLSDAAEWSPSSIGDFSSIARARRREEIARMAVDYAEQMGGDARAKLAHALGAFGRIDAADNGRRDYSDVEARIAIEATLGRKP